MSGATPVVGASYLLAEKDYRYGTGPLLARVTKLVRQTTYNNEPWYEVEAVAKPPSYTGPGQERLLYVKAASLKNARRG
jgi:hypothetical protein